MQSRVDGPWYCPGLAALLAVLVAGPLIAEQPRFDDAFWKHWGDGQAEIAAYDLTISRYGQQRRGTALTIFVTEHFADAARVKSERGGPGSYPVMKLNLIQDFQTGVYDYNLMTSVFVDLVPAQRRPAGTPVKVSFSSQEWCGHVYQQLLFDRTSIRQTLHSYFEGEADASASLNFPERGLSEEVLFHWARGLAWPVVEPAAQTRVEVLTSLQRARLEHTPLTWTPATLTRSGDRSIRTVPAGRFEVERLTAALEGGPTWTFEVEVQPPRRIVQWTCSDGSSGTLRGSKRLSYWKMNANGAEAALAELGLPVPRIAAD